MCEIQIETGSVPVPDGMDRVIAHKIAWLEKQYPELTRCSVAVTGPEPQLRHRPYRFRLALHAQGLQTAVSGRADPQPGAAFASALDAARRTLEDRARRRIPTD